MKASLIVYAMLGLSASASTEMTKDAEEDLKQAILDVCAHGSEAEESGQKLEAFLQQQQEFIGPSIRLPGNDGPLPTYLDRLHRS